MRFYFRFIAITPNVSYVCNTNIFEIDKSRTITVIQIVIKS